MALWLAAAVAVLPRAIGLERRLDAAARVRGSESERVDSLLEARFGSLFTQYAVLVISGMPAPQESEGRALLDSIVARVQVVRGVTRVRTAEGPDDTLYVVRAHQMVLLVAGLDPSTGSPDRIVTQLRAATATAPPVPGAAVARPVFRWTGQVVLNADLREASAADARTAERRVLPVTLILLMAALGSVTAAAVSVFAGAVVVGVTLGVVGWLATLFPLSLLLQSLVSMVGLGLGIDYALLVVARFREAQGRGASPADAGIEAAHVAGHTVILSATSVSVGFLALFLVPVTELRSVALGGLLAALIAAIFATTCLPILLAWLGPRVEWGRFGPARERRSRSAWVRWGKWVTRHPGAVLAAAGLPVVILAAQALRLDPGLPTGSSWLPQNVESVRGLHDLERAGRDGVLQAVRLVVELPPGYDALTPGGWSALRRVHATLAADTLIGAVWSFARLDHPRPPSRLVLYAMDPEDRHRYLTEDRRSVLIEAIPRAGADPTAVVDYVRWLRKRGSQEITGLPEARVLVGGLPAMRADYDMAVGSRFRVVVGLVLGGTLLALFTGFRSVLIPLKATILNLLSVGAGFGAMVLAFQDGDGIGRVFAFVPVLVFCTVFGLSMDYEVFLLARVAEGRAAGLEDRAAVVHGLAGAAPVITSAAVVMVTVFAGFAVGDLLVIRMLGLALAVAVLVDATVVRMALGPALIVLAGRWNWWPGRRR